MVTGHHDVLKFESLDTARVEQSHNFEAFFYNFVQNMAEGNMFSDLVMRFDYNQNASERRFL